MQIIPVIDLLGRLVVRAVGGIRGNYRPVVSQLVHEPSALAVARAFRAELGLSHLYLADLDAILHRRPNLEAYRHLNADGFVVMVDAGVRTVDEARAVLSAGAAAAVIGLETIPGPGLLTELCAELDPERLIFSLDLRHGLPIGDLDAWGRGGPLEIARRALAARIRRMIVLDLASVGVGSGIATRDLCREIRELTPALQLITGGGVRTIADLEGMRKAGIDGVLVASALHDGQITRADLDGLAPGP